MAEAKTDVKKEFQELEVGEGFDPGFAHIIEKNKDRFPDRPWGTYMKTGDDEAVWLRTGRKRSFSPNQRVRVQEIKIETK